MQDGVMHPQVPRDIFALPNLEDLRSATFGTETPQGTMFMLIQVFEARKMRMTLALARQSVLESGIS